jgi:hypothetical protein
VQIADPHHSDFDQVNTHVYNVLHFTSAYICESFFTCALTLSKSEGEGQSFVKRLKLRGQGDIIKVRESTFCKKTKVEYARSHIMEVREAKLDICKSFSQYSLYFNNLLLIYP